MDAKPPAGACDDNETTPCCKDADFDCEVEAAAGYFCDLDNINIRCRNTGAAFQPDDAVGDCSNRGSHGTSVLSWSAVPTCKLDDELHSGVYVHTYSPPTTTTKIIFSSFVNYSTTDHSSSVGNESNATNESSGVGIAEDDAEEYSGPPGIHLFLFGISLAACVVLGYASYSNNAQKKIVATWQQDTQDPPREESARAAHIRAMLETPSVLDVLDLPADKENFVVRGGFNRRIHNQVVQTALRDPEAPEERCLEDDVRNVPFVPEHADLTIENFSARSAHRDAQEDIESPVWNHGVPSQSPSEWSRGAGHSYDDDDDDELASPMRTLR